jgi:RNA polymerase sigma-70 factor (ECF subfamily)
MELSDPALVVKALGGDEEAFRVLTERHSLSVFHLAYRMTGNEEDAEDVVQETFLRAFRSLKRYESRSQFSTWLYRIAANYSLDLIRSRKRFADVPQSPEHGNWLNEVACSNPTAERIAISGQIRETIGKAMQELTSQERAAFVMRHYHELSINEIGQNLGLGENATKHSIFRAVRKLRRALEPLVARV